MVEDLSEFIKEHLKIQKILGENPRTPLAKLESPSPPSKAFRFPLVQHLLFAGMWYRETKFDLFTKFDKDNFHVIRSSIHCMWWYSGFVSF